MNDREKTVFLTQDGSQGTAVARDVALSRLIGSGQPLRLDPPVSQSDRRGAYLRWDHGDLHTSPSVSSDRVEMLRLSADTVKDLRQGVPI